MRERAIVGWERTIIDPNNTGTVSRLGKLLRHRAACITHGFSLVHRYYPELNWAEQNHADIVITFSCVPWSHSGWPNEHNSLQQSSNSLGIYGINPYTATACKWCTCREYILRSYNTFAFNAMRFDENPFTFQCEKENKKAEGFQISHF